MSKFKCRKQYNIIMEPTEEQKDSASAFMHNLAAEDVDAANIMGTETMGSFEVQASLPEDDLDEATSLADNYGFKPAGERGEDDRTGETVFSFEPRF